MRGMYSELVRISVTRIDKFMPTNLPEYKSDTRPAAGGWAPGNYMNRCFRCGGGFIGDKRAMLCADCAYASIAEQFAKVALDKVKERTASGESDENDDALLELAARIGYGNVRRVKYDPEKHGEVVDVEPGQEMWFWGEEKV